MKWKSILTLIIVLSFSLVLTPSVSAIGEEIDVDADNLQIGDFDIYAEYQPPEKLKKSEISWKKINGTKTFYPKFKDSNLYGGDDKLKVPLTEFHFVIDQRKANEYCTLTQYYKRCSWEEPDFSVFMNKNNITSTNITPVYLSDFESFWEIFFSTNWGTFANFEAFAKKPVGYRYSFYGIIDDLDPEINEVFTSSSQGFFNFTRARFQGISLDGPLNGTDAYNVSNGDFKLLGVFFNQSGTNWNLTFSIADSNGSNEVFDKCQDNISCISYYPLDTTQGGNVYGDARGSNEGTPTGAPDNATGISSGAINFDGANERMNINGLATDTSLVNALTGAISLWARLETDDGQENMPFSIANSVGGTRSEIFIDFDVRTNNDFFRGVMTIDGTTQWEIRSDVDSIDEHVGEWIHFLLNHNGTDPEMYVNGEIENTTMATDVDRTIWFKGLMTDAGTNPNNARISGIQINTGFFVGFNGQIDEVMIYNTSLTFQEVQDLYKAGLSQHANTNITLSTRTSNSYNVSDPSLVLFMAFNNNTAIGENGTHWVDQSRYANNGSLGKIGQNPLMQPNGTVGGDVGFGFSGGTLDWINVSDHPSLDFGGGNFTMSVWLRPHGDVSADEFIISKRPGGGTAGWEIALNSASASGDHRAALRGTSSTLIGEWEDTLTDNVWQHFVFGRNGSTSLFAYVDGVDTQVVITTSNNVNIDTTEPIKIGISRIATGLFDGEMDELILYNRTLSTSEIQNLFELGSHHIEWIGGEDNFTEIGVIIDGDPSSQTTNAQFMQYKTFFQTNNTNVSAFQINHTIFAGVSSVAPPVLDSITINFTDPTPANGTTLLAPNILVNVTVTNTSSIDQINISLFNSTQDIINSTLSSGLDTPLFINFSGLAEGNYFINATVNDTVGTINFTGTNIITINAVLPDINFTNPTLANGSAPTGDSIVVNVTSSDPLLDTLIIFLFNSTQDQINSTSSTSSPFFINFSGLVADDYFINASVNDTSNQLNFTETRKIRLNLIPPVIVNTTTQNFTQVISGGDGGTVVRGDNVTINATVTDINGAGDISAVWVVIWEGIVGGPQILLQFMTDVFGDVYSTVVDTNSSFNLGDVNYSIFANDSIDQEVNITANFTLITEIGPTNVSIEHGEFSLGEIIFNSPTYVLVNNVTINASSVRELVFRGQGQVQKASGGASSTLSIRVSINGNVLFDNEVRTVTSATDIGVFNFVINSTTDIIGENRLLVEVKDDGAGAMNISNFRVSVDRNQTTGGADTSVNVTMFDGTFSSTSFINIFNATLEKVDNSTTIIDSNHIFSTTSGGGTVPQCYYENAVTGERTQNYERSLPGANVVASSGIAFASSIRTQGTETWQVWCRSDDSDIIANNLTMYLFSTIDSSNQTIQHLHNQTNTVQSISGLGNKIAQFDNYVVGNGSSIFLMGSIFAQSTSGSQTGSDSPGFSINRTGSLGGNCTETFRRSFSGNTDIGTIKFSLDCNELSPGDQFNVSVFADVRVGETLNILNASITGYEIFDINVSLGNTAPIVTILVPFQGENITGIIQVNASVSDINGNRFTQNLTVSNGTDNILIAQEFPDSIFNITWDTTTFADGFWNITWSALENDTSMNLFGNDTIEVMVLNNPPTVEITVPVEGSTIVASTFNINYLVNGQGLSVLVNCFFNVDNGPNTTIACGSNVTGLTTTDGLHNVTVFANNTVGLIGSDTNSFNFVNVAVEFFLSKLFPNNKGLPFLKGGESNDFR